jgi:ABC-type transport system involved in cytochrome bd biosynthesis fused ATPase/permease subunit
VRLAFQGPLSRLPAQAGANMQTMLRRDVFAAFTRASWSAQSRDREGQLQELLTNQVSHASMGALQAAG